MSTTFEIYPSSHSKLPTFGDIYNLTLDRLKQIWDKYELVFRPELNFTMIHTETNIKNEVDFLQPAIWDEYHYLWISFVDVGGGSNGYFNLVSEFSRDVWLEEAKELQNKDDEHSRRVCNIAESLNIGYYWTFRRSAGQSAIISLTYGLLASSMAELTNGYIWSEDGGWNYSKFPAKSTEFDLFYMNPEMAQNKEDKGWAEWCINTLKELYR